MDFPIEFPQALRDYFTRTYPPLSASETLLSGMSGSYVYRVSFGDSLVIVKSSLRPQETNFYRDFAPLLRGQGVAIPEVYWLGEEAGQYWLALENIPRLWPRESWSADPQVLEVLAGLHRANLPTGLDLTRLYRLKWTDEITATALAMLGAKGERVAPMLQRWQHDYQHLFTPVCPISADPNPGNWGLRSDGSPVLFDWERFTFGSPSIDLAILIPFLPDKATFRHYAESYRKLNLTDLGNIQEEKKSLDDFVEDVKVAKVWTVVEFMYMYTTGPTGITKEHIEYLCDHLPDWLESLV